MRQIELSDEEITCLIEVISDKYEDCCTFVESACEAENSPEMIKLLIQERETVYGFLIKICPPEKLPLKQVDRWIPEPVGWRFYCPVCGHGSPDALPECKECGTTLEKP